MLDLCSALLEPGNSFCCKATTIRLYHGLFSKKNMRIVAGGLSSWHSPLSGIGLVVSGHELFLGIHVVAGYVG